MKSSFKRFAVYFKNLKIQTKLVLIFLVLTLIPFSVLGMLSYYKSSSVILNEVMDNSNQIVKQVSDKIDYNMKDLDKSTLLFTWDNQTQRILSSWFSKETLNVRKSNQMELESAIQTFLNTRLEIESVYIYRDDSDEYYIDNSIYNQEIRKRIIMKRSEITHEAEKLNGKNNWSTINLDKGLITGSRIIYDTINLNKLGLLVINVQENYLKNLYKDVVLSPNSFFIVCSKSGQVISTNSNFRIEDLTKFLAHKRATHIGKYDMMTGSLINKQYFIVDKPTNFVDWEVYGVIPRSELLGGITKIGTNILLTGIVCSAITIFLLIFLSSLILNPIKRIMKLMKRVEQEDFSVKAEPEGKDEFGELTIVFNKMIEKIRYLIEEVYKQQLVKKEAELKMLQAQINPHFLYNTLDSINWIAKINGIEDISKMVVALGQLMRISISKGTESILLKQELEYAGSYLTIQSMRYRDKFNVMTDIQEEAMNCYVPKMILQPIIENALVHGIEPKVGRGSIEITARIKERDLYIYVHDDGHGMEKAKCDEILKFDDLEQSKKNNENHTGLGLSNVNRRIKMIYNNEYGLEISSEEGMGTSVIIHLPVIIN